MKNGALLFICHRCKCDHSRISEFSISMPIAVGRERKRRGDFFFMQRKRGAEGKEWGGGLKKKTGKKISPTLAMTIAMHHFIDSF